ncbi:hypothetical protein BDZ85DRAFT_247755 [Elsinoe ampelina]|uniref:Uncharacterized protein n=1 Tax=Elsinoe ampelina TaxID=302913 RepID=A0A6A6GJ31_9PEZI|nr:hypothetical protein BDZ85DRAFT_247755 [Elsinoe ampelina]
MVMLLCLIHWTYLRLFAYLVLHIDLQAANVRTVLRSMATYYPYGAPSPAAYQTTTLPYEVPLRPAIRPVDFVHDDVYADAPEDKKDKKDKKVKDKIIKDELFCYEIHKDMDENSWRRCHQERQSLSQANLDEELENARKGDGKASTAMMKYRDLSDNRRGQVRRLLDRVHDDEKDPEAQWTLMHVDKHKVKSNKRDPTTYMLVILKRHAKEKKDATEKNGKGDKVKTGDLKAGKGGKDKKAAASSSRSGDIVDLDKPFTTGREKKDKGDKKNKNKDHGLDSDDDPLDAVFQNETPSSQFLASPPPPPNIYSLPEVHPGYPQPAIPQYLPLPFPPTPTYDTYTLPQTRPAYPVRADSPPLVPYPEPLHRSPPPPRKDSFRNSFSPRNSGRSIPYYQDSGTESTFSEGLSDFTIPSSSSKGKGYTTDRRPREEDYTRYPPRRSDDRVNDHPRSPRRRSPSRRRDDYRRPSSRHRSPSPRRRSPTPPRDRYTSRRHSPEPTRNDRRDDRRDGHRDYRPRNPSRHSDSYSQPRYDPPGGHRSGPSSAHDSRSSDGVRSRKSDAEQRQYERWGDDVRSLIKKEQEQEDEQRRFESFKEGYLAGRKTSERGR